MWRGQKTECSQFLKTAVRFRLFEFGIGRTGLGSDYGRGNNHSDEGKGNQNIMHGSSLLCESSLEHLHTLMIGLIGKFLNPTKTAQVI
jgi:hypothetical protein